MLLAENKFARHALVIGVDHKNTVSVRGETFRDGDGRHRLCDTALEI
jgi:hypothetical protein